MKDEKKTADILFEENKTVKEYVSKKEEKSGLLKRFLKKLDKAMQDACFS